MPFSSFHLIPPKLYCEIQEWHFHLIAGRKSVQFFWVLCVGSVCSPPRCSSSLLAGRWISSGPVSWGKGFLSTTCSKASAAERSTEATLSCSVCPLTLAWSSLPSILQHQVPFLLLSTILSFFTSLSFALFQCLLSFDHILTPKLQHLIFKCLLLLLFHFSSILLLFWFTGLISNV